MRAKRLVDRTMQEWQYATSAYFVTLTYREQDLPWKGEYPSLHKDDLREYIEYVRKKHQRLQKKDPSMVHMYPLRIMKAGEYGPENGRPHYHLLVFNLRPELKQDLLKLWKHGDIKSALPMEEGAIHYVTDYMMKEKWKLKEGQVKEFTSWSKNWGIQYVDVMQEYHQKTGSVMERSRSKKQKTLQPYYFKKLYGDDEKKKKERREIIENEIEERTIEKRKKDKNYTEFDRRRDSSENLKIIEKRKRKNRKL